MVQTDVVLQAASASLVPKQDLPRVVMGFSGVTTAVQVRPALTVLRELVEPFEDTEFDRFVAQSVKAMLRSKGFSSQQLERG